MSRRTVFGTSPAIPGRVNALYMIATFIGGALGSLTGTVTYHWGGWTAIAGTGVVIGLVCLTLLTIELRGHHNPR